MKHTVVLALALSTLTPTAWGDLMQTAVPFTLGIGPTQQTVQLPQFNPALGTLNAVDLNIAGTIQYVLDIFNTGAGPYSISVHDTITVNGTPLLTPDMFSGSIPANVMVFTPNADPLPFGPLTEMFDANTAVLFVGTGTVPFNVVLPAVTIDQLTGATVLNALAFSATSGAITADYTFTPAATAAPEPGSLTALGLGLAMLHLRRRK